MRKIHFYLTSSNMEPQHQKSFFVAYLDTKGAIDNKIQEIHSTCIELLHTSLFEKGYEVFVHLPVNRCIQLKLGEPIPNGRLLKKEHNLKNLLLAGEFGRFDAV